MWLLAQGGWTFTLWGGLHGLGFCAHRLWPEWRGREHPPLGAALAWAGAPLFAGLFGVTFRAENLENTLHIVSAMLGGGVAY